MSLISIKIPLKKIVTLVFCIGLGTPTISMAIPLENYDQVYDEKIAPFFENAKVDGFLTPSDGKKLKYYHFAHPNPKASLIIMPGWTEPAEKYREIIYDFYQYGINIYFMDWRGQGRSSRELDESQKSYIDNYMTYVNDLDLFIQTIVKPSSTVPIYALAHSMGANITAMYLATKVNPIQKVVFSSPMLDIKTPIPETIAYGIATFMTKIGFGDSWVISQGPYSGVQVNRVTTCDIRNAYYGRYRKEHPELIVNGATWSWLKASIEATWEMREKASDIKIPALMFQAGIDLLVETDGQDYVCGHALNCKKIEFPDAMHEILNEVDPLRDKAFNDIAEFLNISKDQPIAN